jgi:hypothetical protein
MPLVGELLPLPGMSDLGPSLGMSDNVLPCPDSADGKWLLRTSPPRMGLASDGEDCNELVGLGSMLPGLGRSLGKRGNEALEADSRATSGLTAGGGPTPRSGVLLKGGSFNLHGGIVPLLFSAGDGSGGCVGEILLSPTICDNGRLLCCHDRVPDLARDVGDSRGEGILGSVASLEGLGERKRCSRPGEALDKERAWSADALGSSSV